MQVKEKVKGRELAGEQWLQEYKDNLATDYWESNGIQTGEGNEAVSSRCAVKFGDVGDVAAGQVGMTGSEMTGDVND